MKQLDLEAPRVDPTQSCNQRTNSPTVDAVQSSNQPMTSNSPAVDAIQSSNQRPVTVQQSMLSNCGGSHPPRQWSAYGTICSASKECHWCKMCHPSNSAAQESGRDSQYAGQTPSSKHRRRKAPQRCDGGRRQQYETLSTNDMANSIQSLEFSAIHKR